MRIPKPVRQELMQSRFKTEDGKPIDQQWFTRKDVQILLDKLEKFLDNTSIATQKELLPMQPIHITDSGIARFKKNRMVDDMYEFSQTNGFGLNEMARRDYAQEERMQFAQLIGYSVSGYGTLSYASSESVEKANAIANLLLTNKDQP